MCNTSLLDLAIAYWDLAAFAMSISATESAAASHTNTSLDESTGRAGRRLVPRRASTVPADAGAAAPRRRELMPTHCGALTGDPLARFNTPPGINNGTSWCELDYVRREGSMHPRC